jgi:predicted phosphodiesterase
MSELRVAVFSDVHGNLHGLEAVLADIEASGPFDAVIAAGDHCLNGPDPQKCLDLVLQSASHVLYGNTDRDIVECGKSDSDLGAKKADSIGWTRSQLGSQGISHLDSMLFEHLIAAPDGSILHIVHANPIDVDRHIFPDRSDEELLELVGGSPASMIAFGHLHIPFVRRIGALTLANIASAGLPRDGDRRATWGEFSWHEGAGWTVQTHRVDYDFQATVRRIFASGMPHPERRAQDLLSASYD